MTMLESFVRERNDALFSLDRNRIEAYLTKYGGARTAAVSDYVFWAGVYKAICGIEGAPKDLVVKARAWLTENGFSIPS